MVYPKGIIPARKTGRSAKLGCEPGIEPAELKQRKF
jgi:hypothetical protein